MNRRLALVLVAVLSLTACERFDRSFGGDGTVDFHGGIGSAVVANDGDGIVVLGIAGSDGPAVVHYDADGAEVGRRLLRGDFRLEKAEIAGDPRGGYVAVVSPGRGGRGFAVIRLAADLATASTTYHGGDIHVADVAVTKDGTAVVVNERSTHVAFVDADGRSRIVETPVGDFSLLTSVVAQPDGKVVVGGISAAWEPDGDVRSDVLLVRYTADRRVDATFGWRGVVLHDLGGGDEAQDLAIAPDGGLVASAHSSGPDRMTQLWVVRLSADGRVHDTSVAPTTLHAEGRTVHVRPDGRVVTAGLIGDGQSSDLLTAQWLADGRPDPAWGEGGIDRTDLGGFDMIIAGALLADGRLLAATSDAVVRYVAP